MKQLVAPFLSVTLSVLLIAGPAAAQDNADLRLKCEATGQGTLAIQVTDPVGAPVSDAAVVFRLPDDAPASGFSDGTRAAVAYTDERGHAEVTGIAWGDQPGTSTVRITATRGTLHGSTSFDHLNASAKPAVAAPPAAVQTAPREQVSIQQPGQIQPKPVVVPTPNADSPSALPRVSVTTAPKDEKLHSGGSKKWILIALLAAGAGAGVAVMTKGKSGSSSSSTTTSSGVSIGAPTVTVGNP